MITLERERDRYTSPEPAKASEGIQTICIVSEFALLLKRQTRTCSETKPLCEHKQLFILPCIL